MLNRIILLSVRHKLIVLLLTAFFIGFGIYAIFNIPLGAVPDITTNQVQVITTSTSLSTQDVEQFITYPVELEMSNLPGVTEIRSISKFGLSVVTIVFEDGMGTYLPRQLIAEKIKSAAEQIPEGFGTPEMGPISTGLGEIYQYILDTEPGFEERYSIMELRTIQDWLVKRQLSGIPGVVEVNTWGGYLKQYEVALDPERLRSQGVTLLEVFDAVEKSNSVAGGAYIEKENQSYFIRGEGLITSLEELEQVVVSNDNGVPLLIRDLATVRFGHANRFGAITANGEGEKVMGQIMMLKDANSNRVIEAVKQRVEEVQETLPEGVYINPILERSELIGKTSHTVFENLLFGCLIVFVIVVLLLGDLRSGLVIASIIPLSLLFTISMMFLFGIDANLMSLGALDFGIIIDGAVIIVEFIAVKLTMNRGELEGVAGEKRQSLMDRITYDGASRMINSAIFGQLIILIVFIPVLSLSGVEGKMFRPMALSFSFALIGAMFFGITWLPMISSVFLRPEKRKKFLITRWVMRLIYRTYDPVIRWSYSHKWVIFTLGVGSLIITGVVFSRMGGEFVPTLDEGDFVIQPVLRTGTSLSKTVEMTTRMEQILMESFPEVDQIVCRIGAAEVPTDPMSMEEIDMIIKLRPKDEWVSAESKEELANRFKEALGVIPGVEYEFTQPIEMRFNELITGVRADLAIKIFGEDLMLLDQKAQEIKELIDDVPGAADVIIEKTVGLPQMSVEYDRSRLAYYGLTVEELNRYLAMAFGGSSAGVVFEGERRFDLVVRLLPQYRNDIEHLRNLPVTLPGGRQVPLREVAAIDYTTGPAKISRDDTRRRVVVSVNVRNRDLESLVEEIRGILDEGLALPAGYSLDYGGQFENLQNASRRLRVAVPIALLLIFIFLHFAFSSFKEAALIFTAVPLSAVGGVFLLLIRGMPFSISAGIGFIALFGVAVLNGIVLIDHLKELKASGDYSLKERILKGSRERLRPVLLTASAAALGFLPMAISTSAGAEVQRPLATVVIGGLVTSTLLTMLMLPLLYAVVDDITGIQWWPPRFRRNRTVLFLLLLILPFKLHSQTNERDHEELTLQTALDIAFEHNGELEAYRLQAEESRAWIRTAYAIDRTSFFFNCDENNVAANDYPIGVLGGSQRFDFPTLYGARKDVNEWGYLRATDLLEQKRRMLARDVSKTYYRWWYLHLRKQRYRQLDSIYADLSRLTELGYRQGELKYLDWLNARSTRQQVILELNRVAGETERARLSLFSLMQYDTIFLPPSQEMSILNVLPDSAGEDPGLRFLRHTVRQLEAELRVEKQELLPDITVSYFNGTNRYPGARNYQGFEVGMGLPLFFGNQRARIEAKELSMEAALHFQQSYLRNYEARIAEGLAELETIRESVEFYTHSGHDLSRELIRFSKRSLEAGEIDVFQFIQSMERALEIELGYLDDLHEYNQKVLDINYMTLN